MRLGVTGLIAAANGRLVSSGLLLSGICLRLRLVARYNCIVSRMRDMRDLMALDMTLSVGDRVRHRDVQV